MKGLCAILAFLMPFFAQSSTELVGSEIKLRGKIVKPPCTINGGKQIDIDFGQLGVNRIEGDNYAQPFTLQYFCEGVSIDKVLKYIGMPTEFDDSAVQSNITNFGIRLQHIENGIAQPFKVGGELAIPASLGASQFTATPVKKTGVTLKEGAFSAAATFQLEYP